MGNYRVDHVIFAVPDLGDATRRFRETYGLEAVPGGRHPDWGTANRIVPLGDEYLELVQVVDPVAAVASDFGAAILAALEQRTSMAGWAVATDDLASDADRLGLTVSAGSRVRPDGSTVRWRLAGVSAAMRSGGALPFFIEWDVPAGLHPGASDRPADEVYRISRLDVSAPAGALESWLGVNDLPLQVSRGSGGVNAVIVSRNDGELRLA